jgi:hypothetical protein
MGGPITCPHCGWPPEFEADANPNALRCAVCGFEGAAIEWDFEEPETEEYA